MLPEVSLDDARIVSERLREVVEATHVVVGTSAAPIHVTIVLVCLRSTGRHRRSIRFCTKQMWPCTTQSCGAVTAWSPCPRSLIWTVSAAGTPMLAWRCPSAALVPRPEPAGEVVRSQGG